MPKNKIKNKILDFLFPLECLGCGQENLWFCHECFRKLELLPSQRCLFCEAENLSGHTCANCRQNHYLDGIFSAGNYGQKELSLLIRHFKYSLINELAETLSDFLTLALKAYLKENGQNIFNSNNYLLPIPLHPKREKWRGFNQSEIIASHLAKKFGWEKISCLKKIKNSKPQAKLNESKRLNNLNNCFCLSGDDPAGKKIILVDDVATTGATLEEAARILKKAGAKSVWGLTIARG